MPFWNIAVFFVYAMRRVDCPACGVTVEKVPWGDGKEHLTTSYRWFLARWARRLSWMETANAFNTTWDNVFRSVKHAVLWGIAHRDLSGIEVIGVYIRYIRVYSVPGTDSALLRDASSCAIPRHPQPHGCHFSVQCRAHKACVRCHKGIPKP